MAKRWGRKSLARHLFNEYETAAKHFYNAAKDSNKESANRNDTKHFNLVNLHKIRTIAENCKCCMK